MRNLPSDLKILTNIYERYYDEFRDFSREEKSRACKVYVPIDIRAIAANLQTDEYLLFGRLYNHINKKYESNEESPLFSINVGKDRHAIHFPLLSSVIAGLQEEVKRQNTTWVISIAAALISLLSLGFTCFNLYNESNKDTSQKKLIQEAARLIEQINPQLSRQNLGMKPRQIKVDKPAVSR